jgi:light-regulated signal transduction histidine kinase (bacteriophytochrome)
MISDTGTYAGIRVTNSDITFRKNLELELRRKTEQLERSNKDLEQFAYAAAHDLREPLVAVAAQLKALERLLKMNTNEGVQRTLSRAMNHVLSMDSMLQAIFSCSSVNSTPSSFEISDANVCLKNAISNLAFSIKKSGTVVTSDNLPLVNIGASQLMTIFRNLIAYSIKFRNAFPPRIHVGCAPCRSVNQFHVTDNGMGIAPPYLDRIFRLLDRVHDISGPMNAGIGLLTCRSIVEQYGGNLWLDSKPAQGSTFFFTLPAVDMETSRTSFTEAKLGCS